jgi:hypothetical protein
MRRLVEEARIRRLMRSLGRATDADTRVYFTGGATAVLEGWRTTTVDVNLRIVPDRDELLRAVPALKEELELNVELAAPSDFIPELPGWEARSRFVANEGHVSFYHYDFYAQALAKIERGHTQDAVDVAAMFDRGLVEPQRLRELFEAIEPLLYRYPAIDPKSFRRALEAALAGHA